MREPLLMKFGMQQQVRTAMTDMRSNIKIFKIQNGGRSLLESIRCHNSPANGPTGTQLRWSHPIMFQILEMLQLLLRWDRLGRLLSGRVQATPLLQNRFLGIWSLLFGF